jgi:hypothetical protein
MCAWTESEHKFAIHVPPDVISRLGSESWIAFKRVPRRGLEIGGVLLGRTETRDDTTTFWIDGFQQVESEHRSGPSYVLSDSDFIHLQEAIKKNKSASLGIYRSQTRSEQLVLQESDVKLFGRCFEAGPGLFLMLGPVPGIAAFFAQAEGSLKCVHQFTLPSSRMSMMAGKIVPNSQPEPPRVLPLREAPPSDPPVEHAETPIEKPAILVVPKAAVSRTMMNKTNWIIGAVAAVLVLAASASMTLKAPRPIPAAPDRKPPEFLHLTVERAGSALRLVWDQNSSTVHAATRAVLHIEDGNAQTDRDLSPSQLSAGSMTYEPKSQDVTFRMDVYSTQPNASGLVQVVNLPAAAEIPRIVPAAAERKPFAPQAIATPTPVHTPIAQAPITQVPNQTAKVVGPVLPAVSTTPASPIPAAAPGSVERTEPAVADRPVAERPSTATRRPPITDAPIPSPAPTVQSDPSIDMVAEPISDSRLVRVIGKVPLLRRLRKQEQTTAAVPMYQAQPTLRTLDRQGLVQPTSVAVKVYVAESGAVKRAEVVELGDPPNWSLANASLVAARKWTFQPARLDDMVVSSEVILHFRFNP